MTLLTVFLGLGGGYLMFYSLGQKDNIWGLAYLLGLAPWTVLTMAPLMGHWFKYWEEKLK